MDSPVFSLPFCRGLIWKTHLLSPSTANQFSIYSWFIPYFSVMKLLNISQFSLLYPHLQYNSPQPEASLCLPAYSQQTNCDSARLPAHFSCSFGQCERSSSVNTALSPVTETDIDLHPRRFLLAIVLNHPCGNCDFMSTLIPLIEINARMLETDRAR